MWPSTKSSLRVSVDNSVNSIVTWFLNCPNILFFFNFTIVFITHRVTQKRKKMKSAYIRAQQNLCKRIYSLDSWSIELLILQSMYILINIPFQRLTYLVGLSWKPSRNPKLSSEHMVTAISIRLYGISTINLDAILVCDIRWISLIRNLGNKLTRAR